MKTTDPAITQSVATRVLACMSLVGAVACGSSSNATCPVGDVCTPRDDEQDGASTDAIVVDAQEPDSPTDAVVLDSREPDASSDGGRDARSADVGADAKPCDE